MSETEVRSLVLSCPLFKGIDREELQKLAYEELFVEENYKKGQRVVCADGPGALGVLARGKMRVGGKNDERRAVINEMSPGAVFGFASLFENAESGGKRFESDVWAKTDVTVLWMPERSLGALFDAFPASARNVIAIQAGKIRFLNERIRAFSAPEASDKLLSFLESLPRGENGAVPLPCDMSALARRLGIGRASLYRAFRALEEKGAGKKEGKTFVFA